MGVGVSADGVEAEADSGGVGSYLVAAGKILLRNVYPGEALAAEMAFDMARTGYQETTTVWANTAHMGVAQRVYVTGGTVVAGQVGVRNLSDAGAEHAALDRTHSRPPSGFSRERSAAYN